MVKKVKNGQEGSAVCTKLWILAYPNTLPFLFLNVKLVTILEMEVNLFLIAELSFKNSFFPYNVQALYSIDPAIIKKGQ